ncbi:MAG: ABC transporter substrate-binding protein, partial [Candidatus Bathyarchaeota archaeon]
MDRDSEILISFALGLVFLIVFIFPEQAPQRNLSGVIEIGVISPTDETYAQYEYLAGLAEDELNAICNESELGITFDFNVSSGESSPARVYELVEAQWRQGVDIFVAGGYHSQLTAMSSFLNDNEILVLSPSSTYVDMNLDDYIYRMSPNDSVYAPTLALLLKDYGYDRILLLGRESLVIREGAPFSNVYEALGGEVIDIVTYPWEVEFNTSLDQAEVILGSNYDSGSDIGILLLDYVQADEILRASEPYSRLSNATWINIDAYRYPSMNIVPYSTDVKLLSPSPVLVPSEKTRIIGDMFENRFDEELDFVDGCVYDSCMLLGLSIIELDST